MAGQGSPLIVTAELAWYDEPPAMLDRCVRSLEGFADTLIAVDGSYQMIPGKKYVSPKAQGDAILKAAKAVGIKADVYTPDSVWPGQVSKRNAMLKLLPREADYVYILDADHVVDCPDTQAVRDELEQSDADAFRLDFFTPVPDGFDMARSPHQWHEGLAGRTTKIPLLFYNYPGMRMETRHFWYSAIRDGRRIALLGCGGMYPPCVTDDLQAPFRIVHECFSRPQHLLDRNRDFCVQRDAEFKATGVEA